MINVMSRKKVSGRRDAKVTEAEMAQCDRFCRGRYVAMIRKKRAKSKYAYRTLRASDLESIVDSCKSNFCNPKCQEKATLFLPATRARRTRYVCPACTGDFRKLKRFGAITNCVKDLVFYTPK